MVDLDKEQWVAAARKSFVPSRREACAVCGKFMGIAQAHHLVPLALQYDRGFERPDHEHVWLCPTHHTIVHLFLIERQGSPLRENETLIGAVRDLDDRGYQIVMRLLGRAGRHT